MPPVSSTNAIANPSTARMPEELAPDWMFRLFAAALLLLPLSSAISALLILIVAGCLFAWRRKRNLNALPLSYRTSGVLLGTILLSVVCSVAPSVSWLSLPLTAGYLVVIWVTAALLDHPSRYWQAQRLLFWGTVAWSVLGIVVSLMHWHWNYNSAGIIVSLGTWDNRANSIFMHPNILSGYLLLSLGISLALRSRDGLARQIRYNSGIAVVLLCQILTQSRSGWIGTFTLVLLAGIFLDRRLLIQGLVGIGVAGIFLHHMITRRLSTLAAADYASNSNRLRVWHSAQNMIKARPLTGFGPGSWPTVYPHFRDPLEWEHLPHAHSFFLHLGAEYGLLMLGCLLTLIGLTAWRSLRACWKTSWQSASLALASSIVAYLVIGVFEFIFSEGRNSILFFMSLGLLVAVQRYGEAELATANPDPLASSLTA